MEIADLRRRLAALPPGDAWRPVVASRLRLAEAAGAEALRRENRRRRRFFDGAELDGAGDRPHIERVAT